METPRSFIQHPHPENPHRLELMVEITRPTGLWKILVGLTLLGGVFTLLLERIVP